MNTINKEAIKLIIIVFLTSLFGDSPGYLGIWTQIDRLTRFFLCSEIEQAAEYILSRCRETNVYFNVCLQRDKLDPIKRGQAKDALVIPGLWCDVDIAGINHKATNCPNTEQADDLLAAFILKPSITLNSGGGWHCYWLLDQALVLDSPDLYVQASELIQRFQRALIQHFANSGFKLDNTSDLARLLRLPSTYNHKTSPPLPVEILEQTDTRYTLKEIESAVEELESVVFGQIQTAVATSVQPVGHQTEVLYSADPDMIFAECSFTRYCRDNASTLEEPAWYDAQTIWARTSGGRDLCHQMSRPHPDYCFEETEAKITHALKDTGPATCKKIRANFPHMCGDCRYNITSPIVLGNIAPWEDPIPLINQNMPTFPKEILPPWLQEFVEALATATQTPIDMAGMLSLTLVGACGAKAFKVQPRPGWEEPLNIYSIVIMEPGNRKSAVMNEITTPMQEHEAELIEIMEPEYKVAKAKREGLEQALGMAKTSYASSKAGKNTKGPSPAELESTINDLSGELADTPHPHRPRLLCDDVTVEKLAGLMAEQGGPMALFSAEGGFINTLGGRYSQGLANFDVVLKAHNCEVVRVDRVGREPEYIKKPNLSLGLAVQMAVLNDLMNKPEFRGKGLSARILYCIPGSNVGTRMINPPPVPDPVRFQFKNKIKSLLKYTFPPGEQEEKLVTALLLDQEARTELIRFETWLEPQLSKNGTLGYIQDWASKLAGAIVRVAGILHIAEHATEVNMHIGSIKRETMAKAIILGKYLINHAKLAFDLMGSSAEIESAQQILDWINSKGVMSFTKRGVYCALHNVFRRASEVDAPLNVLLDHGYIKEYNSVRRDQRKFLVNPRKPVAVVAVDITPMDDPPTQSEDGYDIYDDESPF